MSIYIVIEFLGEGEGVGTMNREDFVRRERNILRTPSESHIGRSKGCRPC